MSSRLLRGRVCSVGIGKGTKVGREGVVLFYKRPAAVLRFRTRRAWEIASLHGAYVNSWKHYGVGVKEKLDAYAGWLRSTRRQERAAGGRKGKVRAEWKACMCLVRWICRFHNSLERFSIEFMSIT